MVKSVWPVDGLHSGSQGLAEGDTEVTGLCPSVFVCAAIVYCVCWCVCVRVYVHLCLVCARMSVLLARNVP